MAVATAPRKFTSGHFAFMRAVVQGIDVRASWDRYLRTQGEHDDLRKVRSTIARMRTEFTAAARQKSCGNPNSLRGDFVRLTVRSPPTRNGVKKRDHEDGEDQYGSIGGKVIRSHNPCRENDAQEVGAKVRPLRR